MSHRAQTQQGKLSTADSFSEVLCLEGGIERMQGSLTFSKANVPAKSPLGDRKKWGARERRREGVLYRYVSDANLLRSLSLKCGPKKPSGSCKRMGTWIYVESPFHSYSFEGTR